MISKIQAIGLSSRNPCHSTYFGIIQAFLESFLGRNLILPSSDPLWNDCGMTHSHHSGIMGMRLKLENEEIKEITANWHCFSEMTPKWPECCWNERNERDFKTQVKFGGAKIEASYWSRAQDRGLWLVKSGWFQKFKPYAFRQEIPVTPLILASLRRFRSHSWDEISFCRHWIHYGKTAVWQIPLHSKVIHHLLQSDSGWFVPPLEYPWTQRP